MATRPPVTEQPCLSRVRCPHCLLPGVDTLADAGITIQQAAVDKGGAIFHQETPVLGWTILCRGRAKVVGRTDHGRTVLLRFCGPGDLVSGLTSGFHSFSAVAVIPSLVAFIPEHDVAALARRHPEVLVEVNRRLAEEQRRLVRRMADLAYASVRTRLVRVLLEIGEGYSVAEEEGLRIELPLSLTELAEMVGASRQATCKELQLLRAKGLIEVAWPRVFLSDLERLRQFR